ncbi:hypothetical protein NQ317_008215 [Molorchus minor]|uniref:Uncharacterized protein n=1 Tax=Molorchus minor TaxID=1323400 RepID=A0ABQ9JUZ2_9CUCU|nr:hypothetical protein NQ317_008215 [Molorchus minor]
MYYSHLDVELLIPKGEIRKFNGCRNVSHYSHFLEETELFSLKTSVSTSMWWSENPVEFFTGPVEDPLDIAYDPSGRFGCCGWTHAIRGTGIVPLGTEKCSRSGVAYLLAYLNNTRQESGMLIVSKVSKWLFKEMSLLIG